MFLEILLNSQENTQCQSIKKETLAQVFSREFYEIFKNAFFYRTPPMAGSYLTWSTLWFSSNINNYVLFPVYFFF